MQVVFHCGVHGTDLSRMVKTLMQNRDWLLKNRIERCRRTSTARSSTMR